PEKETHEVHPALQQTSQTRKVEILQYVTPNHYLINCYRPLDPKDEVGPTSDHFIQSTAGARLALTDAPCGAGAAALAFLSTLAELRSAGVLPRMPLNVSFVGGEFSQHAEDHARALFLATIDTLEQQAIFVDPIFKHWNVMDQISTTDLVKACLDHGEDCPAKLLVIANFNGLLVKDRRQSNAEPQLNELIRYASGEGSLAVWIEPEMNRAMRGGGLFSWLTGLFEKKWRDFGRALTPDAVSEPAYTSEAKFQLPLQPERTARVTLAILPIDLSRSAK
ncbi:MAG: hypothetical protein M0P19_15845, partial [Nevskia sp.]|nr:hypothetical protein [Nevskia sp.]